MQLYRRNSSNLKRLAGLERHMGDDDMVSAGRGVRLPSPLLPSLQGRERDAIGAGEGLLEQAQFLANHPYIRHPDEIVARCLTLPLDLDPGGGLLHRCATEANIEASISRTIYQSKLTFLA